MHRLPRRRIVLLGIGHTNAHVLRMWRMKPIPKTELVCVSNYHVATYSGMLPGVMAGQYPEERMEIDLVRLTSANGARLIVDRVVALDADQLELHFADRPPLPFDALSIGIGSIPVGTENVDDTALPIKPMQTLRTRLLERVEQVAQDKAAGDPIRITVVGGGAGGVEITLCLPSILRKVLPDTPLQLTLAQGDATLLPDSLPRTQRRVEQTLRDRGVQLRLGQQVESVHSGVVTYAEGETDGADAVLWATGAAAPALLKTLELPLDSRGFLLTNSTLQTVAELPVFAVGDTGTIKDHPLPKAGVYAVRQGPVLWRNLEATLEGRPLEAFRPQRDFLKLLNLGDGRAVGEYKGLSFSGAWAWRLKDFIDGRFMDKYQDYTPMDPAEMTPDPPPADAVMRCAGCGGKLGSGVLSRVLERLDVPPSSHVLLGLDAPDDAAVVCNPGGNPITVTTDFFVPPLDDAYLSGRIAALNSVSDVFALEARPFAALAMATIPPGREPAQEQFLYELMAGGLRELKAMGATLIGGHTIEADQATIGYTVLADQGEAPPRAKSRLKAGDRLILTKPLGSGILLAAHMQARCRAEWFPPLLACILSSNEFVLDLLEQYPISAITDVTGFGLAGHLIEMLRASHVSAEVAVHRLPLLPGADALLLEGVESTLVPSNLAFEAYIDAESGISPRAPHYRILFDPQTSGGMLIAVSPQDEKEVIEAIRKKGLPASVIGKITGDSDSPRLRIV